MTVEFTNDDLKATTHHANAQAGARVAYPDALKPIVSIEFSEQARTEIR